MFGPRQGVAYAEGLRRSILRLGRFPRSAPIRPGFSAAIRIMPYRSHIVLYEIDPGGVHTFASGTRTRIGWARSADAQNPDRKPSTLAASASTA